MYKVYYRMENTFIIYITRAYTTNADEECKLEEIEIVKTCDVCTITVNIYTVFNLCHHLLNVCHISCFVCVRSRTQNGIYLS